MTRSCPFFCHFLTANIHSLGKPLTISHAMTWQSPQPSMSPSPPFFYFFYLFSYNYNAEGVLEPSQRYEGHKRVDPTRLCPFFFPFSNANPISLGKPLTNRRAMTWHVMMGHAMTWWSPHASMSSPPFYFYFYYTYFCISKVPKE